MGMVVMNIKTRSTIRTRNRRTRTNINIMRLELETKATKSQLRIQPVIYELCLKSYT